MADVNFQGMVLQYTTEEKERNWKSDRFLQNVLRKFVLFYKNAFKSLRKSDRLCHDLVRSFKGRVPQEKEQVSKLQKHSRVLNG